MLMANDCVMVEGSRVGGGERENENGIELSLELSIGGSYAKSKELGESGRNSGGSGECGVFVDPQAKREIQALRRQEARKKREGKLKRVNWKEMNSYSSGSGSRSGNGGVTSNQDVSRVRARDNGNGLLTEPARKRERNGGNGMVNFYGGGMTCLGAIGGKEVKVRNVDSSQRVARASGRIRETGILVKKEGRRMKALHRAGARRYFRIIKTQVCWVVRQVTMEAIQASLKQKWPIWKGRNRVFAQV